MVEEDGNAEGGGDDGRRAATPGLGEEDGLHPFSTKLPASLVETTGRNCTVCFIDFFF